MKHQSPHNCFLLAYSIPLIPWLVERILSEQQANLPDLSQIVIIIPHNELSGFIREEFQKQYPKGLLGPHISNLKSYISQNIALPMDVMNGHTRELELVWALKQHQELFGSVNPWAIAPELLNLFDELNLQNINLPTDHHKLVNTILNQYDPEDRHVLEGPLLKESSIIHLLWQAWQKQLQQDNLLDSSAAYQRGLRDFENADNTSYFYIFTPNKLNNCEISWLSNRLNNKQASLVLQGEALNYAPSDLHTLNYLLPEFPNSMLLHQLGIEYERVGAKSSYDECLQQIFAPELNTNLQSRANDFTNKHKNNPLLNHLSINALPSPEIEAHAVEQQIRRWRSEGLDQIAIVVEDRRMARRIRALLERWGLYPKDSVGWVLSTSSAASSIERWLQCIEEDFDYRPLLDLLKQPFLHSEENRDDFLNLVYRFEQDIIMHENVSRNLQRYRDNLALRSKRLGGKFAADTQKQILLLLQKLEIASLPLQSIIRGEHLLVDFLQALSQSLDLLGISKGLAQDLAGQELLKLLQELQDKTRGNQSQISWLEFRSWLGKCFESNYFISQQAKQGVYLLSLEQTAIMNFDGIIIPGADSDTFPGPGNSNPFFNNSIRINLGLESRHLQQHQRFYLFRRLLSSANQVFFTYSKEISGNPKLISPWLELINSFIKTAYPKQNELTQEYFTRLSNIAFNEIRCSDQNPKLDQTCMPRPKIPENKLPKHISSRSYQQLINCPYAYFAEYVLKLSPPDEVRLALQKSDYGEKVHTCLQAFHSGFKHIAPFAQRINDQTRNQAIEYLQNISNKIFARDIEDNFEHRSWLQQWHNTIPLYIDWQINHAKNWQVSQTEQKNKTKLEKLPANFTLDGRIDRIDINNKAEYFILDYKTGMPPSQKDIDSGEDVQLSFYGLLSNKSIKDAAYLQLKATEVKSRQSKQVPYEELLQNNENRLIKLVLSMQQGHDMPAWGEDKICTYCRWASMCQKRVWSS